MSGSGAPDQPALDAAGLELAVVVARWHGEVTDFLLAGAVRAAAASGIAAPRVVRVPGAYELPLVAATLADDPACDAVVALGVVIRGGTPHFDYVCAAATDGLLRAAMDGRTPVGFGLLTCDTLEQAMDRCGAPGSSEDKGWEATMAALETALVLRGLRGRDSAAALR